MQVRVLLFGQLRDLGGPGNVVMELPEAATVAELLQQFISRVPEAATLAGSLAVAVNQEYAASNQPLHEGDEVALLPPVSGGAEDDSLPGNSFVLLQREPIRRDDLIARLAFAEDGAILTFDGVVRNNTRGRRTLYLDYEAYEGMAVAQMRGLVGQAARKFEVRAIAIVHRLGRLNVGETSICIAVASAHRAAAFEACRFLIDTLKKTVPIWKKEYFEDGAVWADGEPFPPGISQPGEAQSV